MFQVSSEDNVSGSGLACWNACFLITRTTFCILLFIIVCVTSMISKLTFLTMTANIFPPSTKNRLKTLGGTLSYTGRSWIYTDVRWIWGVLIAISAPYLFTVFKYTWVLLFRKTWPMQWRTLLAVYVHFIVRWLDIFNFWNFSIFNFMILIFFAGSLSRIAAFHWIVYFYSGGVTEFRSSDRVCCLFQYIFGSRNS